MSDTSLNRYLGQGDDAAEAAYTPVPVTGTTPEQAVLYVNSEDPANPRLDWWDGADFVPVVVTSAGTGYLQYQDQEAQNTNGGTFTSGAWRTRVLNTEVSDSGGHGTLSSNQITLDAGTYICSAVAPAFACDRHQLRLQNVTDAATVLLGSSLNTSSTATSQLGLAVLSGKFTIGASKALELQHQCQTTSATFGFGVAANFATEIYASIEFWKV